MRGRYAGREMVGLYIETDPIRIIASGRLCTDKGCWEIDLHRVIFLAVLGSVRNPEKPNRRPSEADFL